MQGLPSKLLFLLALFSCCVYAYAQPACSNDLLEGAYGFTVSGINVTAGAQFALTGRFVADGKGHFTGEGTEAAGPKAARIAFKGQYNIEGDCTGSATFGFANGITAILTFVLVNDGNEAFIMDADSGVVETGVAKRQFFRHRRGN
jgi:hypothetical protein